MKNFLNRRIALKAAIFFVLPFLFTQNLSHSQPLENEFLDLIEKKSAQFFLNEINPSTGLIKDRANNFEEDENKVASIAACGFGLTAICIAAERGWIPKKKARKLVLRSLTFFLNRVEHINGFFYHFVDINTGKRIGNCEISSIDTALFLAGAIVAKEYFKDKRVGNLVDKLYDRVNWQWMLNGQDTLSMGFTPESGFLEARWNHYCEHMLLYILAIGSRTFPISAHTWRSWARPVYFYGDIEYINCTPLFTHQYSHAWIDFKNKRDDYADYFDNSKKATLANRQFCIDLENRFETFRQGLWGLTASDGPFGYKAYGGPPSRLDAIDGTVAPTAVCGSIVFTPEESIRTLKLLYEDYKDKLWGRYGFSDSLNLDRDWYASDVIGIDQGITVLMIENYRSGFVWNYFMRNKNIVDALIKVGFRHHPEDLHVIDLRGDWYFKKGGNLRFSRKNVSMKKWGKIKVPSYWEKEGFKKHDGYGWYRKEFEIPIHFKPAWRRRKIALFIGGIDDFDSVYVNGHLVGNFYSHVNKKQSYSKRKRLYIIPKSTLEFNKRNTIAIRVYDKKDRGGIWRGPVMIGPFEEVNFRPVKVNPNDYLLHSLEGKWRYKLGDDLSWKEVDLKDRSWRKIDVPGAIERQGIEGYDGYLWYRCHINIPEDIEDRKKFLYIGSIDDSDEVYFNGELIGKTGSFPPNFETAYTKERKYLLKEELIKYNKENIIAIRVFDIIKEGGIINGPVGIVAEIE